MFLCFFAVNNDLVDSPVATMDWFDFVFSFWPNWLIDLIWFGDAKNSVVKSYNKTAVHS